MVNADRRVKETDRQVRKAAYSASVRISSAAHLQCCFRHARPPPPPGNGSAAILIPATDRMDGCLLWQIAISYEGIEQM